MFPHMTVCRGDHDGRTVFRWKLGDIAVPVLPSESGHHRASTQYKPARPLPAHAPRCRRASLHSAIKRSSGPSQDGPQAFAAKAQVVMGSFPLLLALFLGTWSLRPTDFVVNALDNGVAKLPGSYPTFTLRPPVQSKSNLSNSHGI